MTLGNLGAIRQTNIKRMLAYSGIAQAGYLLVGVAALTQRGHRGACSSTRSRTRCANLAAFAVVIIVAERDRQRARSRTTPGCRKRAPLVALALRDRAAVARRAAAHGRLHGEVLRVPVARRRSGLIWLVAIGVVNSVISLYYYLRVVLRDVRARGRRPSRSRSTGPRRSRCRSASPACSCSGIFPEPHAAAAAHAAAALFGG